MNQYLPEPEEMEGEDHSVDPGKAESPYSSRCQFKYVIKCGRKAKNGGCQNSC